MAVVSMKSLLETGVHFGHRTRRWHPKMKPYIFTERNGIHILDLQQTIVILHEIYELVRDTVADGGTVLFVGTKRQAQDIIAQEATRAGMPAVNQRWLGGTLTNWTTIRQRIDHLEKLEKRRDDGEFDGLKKKELLMVEREIDRLNLRLGGIRNMKKLPDLLFIVDIINEDTAVLEANKLNIPIIAMVDTNCNPDPIDHIIPANDDAIRAIQLIVSKMADAVIEGQNMRKDDLIAEAEEDIQAMQGYKSDSSRRVDLHDASDDELLGAKTRATIKKDKEEEEARRVAEEAAKAEAEAKAAAEAAAAEAEAEADAPVEAVVEETATDDADKPATDSA